MASCRRTRTHTHKNVIHTHTHAHTHAHMHAHTCAHTHKHTHNTHAHTNTHTHMHTHTCTRTHVIQKYFHFNYIVMWQSSHPVKRTVLWLPGSVLTQRDRLHSHGDSPGWLQTHTAPASNCLAPQPKINTARKLISQPVQPVYKYVMHFCEIRPSDMQLSSVVRASAHGAMGCQIDPSRWMGLAVSHSSQWFHDWFNKTHDMCYHVGWCI